MSRPYSCIPMGGLKMFVLQCDLAQPSCGQCLKGKLQCEGYDAALPLVSYVPSASGITEKLNVFAMETKYIEAFWNTHRPSTCASDDWKANVFRDGNASGSSLREAILAIALSRIGHRSADIDLARSGAKHYGSCLRTIARAIQSEQGACSNETLTACILLGLYEVLCAPTSPGPHFLQVLSSRKEKCFRILTDYATVSELHSFFPEIPRE